EAARNLKAVIFDKTGTLTRGAPGLAGVTATASNESDLLAQAAAVEANSEHPLAKAIVAAARQRNLQILPASPFEAPGRGARASINGRSVAIGGPRLLSETHVTIPPQVENVATAWASEGKTVLYVVAKVNCSVPFPSKTKFGLNPRKP